MEAENVLKTCEDAFLVNELRARLHEADDKRLAKLGVVLLNLGSDAAALLAERNVQAAIQRGQEPEHEPGRRNG